MPSQKQLKWSQLKVGLTVVAGSIVLAVLILLMTSTGGMFTHKIVVTTFFDNAGGIQPGAVVRLEGVDIGSVTNVRVVANAARRLTPVQVTMKVSTRFHESLRKDSIATLETAGVLGATYVDINTAVVRSKAPCPKRLERFPASLAVSRSMIAECSLPGGCPLMCSGSVILWLLSTIPWLRPRQQCGAYKNAALRFDPAAD